MAANILNSTRAVQMSLFVVRAFAKMRESLRAAPDLARKLAALDEWSDRDERHRWGTREGTGELRGEAANQTACGFGKGTQTAARRARSRHRRCLARANEDLESSAWTTSVTEERDRLSSVAYAFPTAVRSSPSPGTWAKPLRPDLSPLPSELKPIVHLALGRLDQRLRERDQCSVDRSSPSLPLYTSGQSD